MAICTGYEIEGKTKTFCTLYLSYQFDTGYYISPLVIATDLQSATVVTKQGQEVIGLE
jgi:hypothetical protein